MHIVLSPTHTEGYNTVVKLHLWFNHLGTRWDEHVVSLSYLEND